MQTKKYFNDDVVPFLRITIYIEKKFSFAENSIRIIKIFYQQCIYVLHFIYLLQIQRSEV